jgi:sporadic carbohydrate cluster protein (TIGR04323 family)
MDKLQGYVTVRKFNGYALPVPMQNKLLRSYCEEKQFIYLLPQCEMVQEENYCYLFSTLNLVKPNSHIGMCSVHMLPNNKEKFNKIYNLVKSKNISTHFIFEDICIQGQELLNFHYQSNINNNLSIRPKDSFRKIFNI